MPEPTAIQQKRPATLIEKLRWRAAQYETGPGTYKDLKDAAKALERVREHALAKIHEMHDRHEDASDWLRILAVVGEDMEALRVTLQGESADA